MARPGGCRREGGGRERGRQRRDEKRGGEEGGKPVLGVACPPPSAPVPPAGAGPSNANTRARTPANTYTQAPSGAHAQRLRQTRAAAASLDSWTPESRDLPAADSPLPVPLPTLQFLQARGTTPAPPPPPRRPPREELAGWPAAQFPRRPRGSSVAAPVLDFALFLSFGG